MRVLLWAPGRERLVLSTGLEIFVTKKGPKPDDNGTILFHLLSRGFILLEVVGDDGRQTKMEVTSKFSWLKSGRLQNSFKNERT